MPRPITAHRVVPDARRQDVRYTILRDAVEVTVSYNSAGPGPGPRVMSTRSTFTARIEWEKVTGRNLRVTGPGGESTATAILLLAEYPQDEQGRNVLIETGDWVQITKHRLESGTWVAVPNGLTFECTMSPGGAVLGFKVEATIERRP